MMLLPEDAPADLFPDISEASEEGLLAIGGDLSTERLLAAYARGIFPWYNDDHQPVLWWSPDPRTVLYVDEIVVRRSLQKRLRNAGFSVSLDTDFAGVIDACGGPRRGDRLGGTWITPEMRAAYLELHQLGYAHSVEVTLDDKLAGGLYGVSLGNMFFGESMFSDTPDASKVALVWLSKQLAVWGFRLIDCQLPSDHIFSMGAREISRTQFAAELEQSLAQPHRLGTWQFDISDIVQR